MTVRFNYPPVAAHEYILRHMGYCSNLGHVHTVVVADGKTILERCSSEVPLVTRHSHVSPRTAVHNLNLCLLSCLPLYCVKQRSSINGDEGYVYTIVFMDSDTNAGDQPMLTPSDTFTGTASIRVSPRGCKSDASGVFLLLQPLAGKRSCSYNANLGGKHRSAYGKFPDSREVCVP